MPLRRLSSLISLLALAVAASNATGQAVSPAPKNWTAEEDHRQMMEQLGITALRPGPSGNEQDPNHANYDESKANPFPKLPDVLTLRNGSEGHDAHNGRARRAEIVEDFEREVFGRVPKKCQSRVEGHGDGYGHARRTCSALRASSSATSTIRRSPPITVDIAMTLVFPPTPTTPSR